MTALTEHPLSSTELIKPKLRGVIHQYCFFVSLLTGVFMVWQTKPAELFFATLIYSISLSLLLGTSALYHRIDWDPKARMWMRRLDHTMIFVLIAGTYTPLVYTKIDSQMSSLVLNVVWWAVVFGILLKLVWVSSPKWLSAIIYIALGWFALVPLPDILESWGWPCVTWLLAGGLFYSLGVMAYVLKRPNPIKNVFGYHEIFHSCVVIAAACHYISITYVAW